MGLFSIFEPACAAADVPNLDRDGVETYLLVVKKSFTWGNDGRTLAITPIPVVEADVYEGTPGASALLFEAETAPRKLRVDVLLGGELALSHPVEHTLTVLEVGTEVCKEVVVLGDRVWLPAPLSGVTPSAPRPFVRMPIAWSRSFGGVDPKSPAFLEARNPVGVGFARSAEDAEGQPLPNFEATGRPLSSWRDRPSPVGFGPIDRFWPSRLRYGGTYDRRWFEEDSPFLPHDFDPRFYNAAPEDQQLSAYRPGEIVRLRGMTPEWDTSFALPSFEVAMTVLEDNRTTEHVITPDTIVIEPGARRVSIVGRRVHVPRPNLLSIREVLVGMPTPGWFRARRTRKRYLPRKS